jgi:hypothetical protein
MIKKVNPISVLKIKTFKNITSELQVGGVGNPTPLYSANTYFSAQRILEIFIRLLFRDLF